MTMWNGTSWTRFSSRKAFITNGGCGSGAALPRSNSKPREKIRTTMGLRQGDPLSLFSLFSSYGWWTPLVGWFLEAWKEVLFKVLKLVGRKFPFLIFNFANGTVFFYLEKEDSFLTLNHILHLFRGFIEA